MVITKDRLQHILDDLPDSVEVEIVVDKILLSAKVQDAQEQIANGNFLTEDELDKEIDSWQ